MTLFVFLNVTNVLGTSEIQRLHSGLKADIIRKNLMFDMSGQVTNTDQNAAFALFQSPDHPSMQITQILYQHFDIRVVPISDAFLRATTDSSRQQMDRIFSQFNLLYLSADAIDGLRKKLLQSAWNKLGFTDLGTLFTRVQDIFAVAAGSTRSTPDAASEVAKNFVKQLFPTASADVVADVIKAFQQFLHDSSEVQPLLQWDDASDTALANIQTLFEFTYDLVQPEDSAKVKLIRTLLQRLVVLGGTPFVVDAMGLTANDTAIIVSADNADKVEGVGFFEVDLPLATVENSVALRQSGEYLEALRNSDQYLDSKIQPIVELVTHPSAFLSALHSKQVFDFARDSAAIKYLSKLISRPVAWTARANSVREKENLLQYLRSIIAFAKNVDCRQVSSILLEKLQQLAVYWLKIQNIFQLLDIDDTEKKYSQALLALAAALNNAALFAEDGLSPTEILRCNRIAELLDCMALGNDNILGKVVTPLDGTVQTLKARDVVASVFSLEQLEYAVAQEPGRYSSLAFRFDKTVGLKVFRLIQDREPELSVSLTNGILYNMCMIENEDGNLSSKPLCFDDSFTEYHESQRRRTVLAVADFNLNVFVHKQVGQTDFGNFTQGPSFKVNKTQPLAVKVDSFFDITGPSSQNNLTICVLRITSNDNCSVMYAGQRMAQVCPFPVGQLYVRVKAAVADDPFLGPDFVSPIIDKMHKLTNPQDRRTALAMLSALLFQCTDYKTKYNAAIASMEYDVGERRLERAEVDQFNRVTQLRIAGIKAVLRETMVRRAFDGSLLNIADQWGKFYGVLVLGTALVLPLAWTPFTDDPFLDNYTTPELMAIILQFPEIALAVLTVVFGAASFIIMRALVESWGLLRQGWSACFHKGMQAEVGALLGKVRGNYADSRLIARLDAVVAETPYDNDYAAGLRTHPYEWLAAAAQEMRYGVTPFIHAMLGLLTENGGLRRIISPVEWFIRRLLLRPAARTLVPVTFATLAVYAMPSMSALIDSDEVANADSVELGFLATFVGLLATPGVPLGLLQTVLMCYAYDFLDFDFLLLQLDRLYNVLKYIGGLLVQVPGRAIEGVRECAGAVSQCWASFHSAPRDSTLRVVTVGSAPSVAGGDDNNVDQPLLHSGHGSDYGALDTSSINGDRGVLPSPVRPGL